MNKKIILVISTIIMLSMLISAPTAHAAQPASQIKPMTTINIIQGKITPSGVFFLILEKTPALNQYNTIQQPAHDPSFMVYVYNPNPTTNLTLSIASWAAVTNNTLTDPQWSNISISAPQRQITELDFTAPFTPKLLNMTMEIQGVGYQFQEQAVASPLFPFYDTGELGFFAFAVITTAGSVVLAFGIALLLLKRTHYFPPIQGLKLLFLTLATSGFLTVEIVQNYYQVITAQWYLWDIPILLTSLLLFLSYIPPHVKRGILLRFLAEHTQGEAYTELYPILTSETDNTEAPQGYRSAAMQYLERKSYFAFLKRLIGIQTNIVFLDGKLPDEIAKPRKAANPTRYDSMRQLKRLRNRKRESTDYDYGYLLASDQEITIQKIPIKEGSRWKRRYLIIPLSGHHSSYIEDFLAGIKDSVLKGEMVTTFKEKNAELRAAILSGTYVNDLQIIDKLGEILRLSNPATEPPHAPEQKPESDKTE